METLVLTLLFAIGCRPEPPQSTGPGTPALDPAPVDVEALPVDEDHDGFAVGVDCDDGDPMIHPGALERCNDVDDACDGGDDDGAVSVVGGQAYGSLADALAGAPVLSQVRVCPGTYPGPLTMTRALVVTSSGGPRVTVLDGGGMSRVLNVTADGADLRGFTITHGYAPYQGAGGGAGVYLAPNVDATFSDVVITANHTDGLGGGLLLDERATLTLDGVVSDCAASQGAGAWLRADAVLTGGDLLGNSAAVGGGAGLEAGASLVAVEVAGNSASAGGGGLYVTGDDAHVVDSMIRDNTSAWQGGGISVQQGTLWLDGVTVVSENTATYAGGGIDLFDSTVGGGIVKGNHSGLLGGGIYGTSSRIYGTVLDGNSADRGGGIATDIGGVELEGVEVRGNRGVLGGGLFVGSTAIVTGSSVVENTAISGGAFYVAMDGTIALVDTDLGSGQVDNAPDDIAVENGAGMEALADLYCDAYGCW